MNQPVAFWFRRDLRLEDNTGLFHALNSGKKVVPVFIFDKNILESLPPTDLRVIFIYNTVYALKTKLRKLGSDLVIKFGHPLEIWTSLNEEFNFEALFFNRDYEPYAVSRDESVVGILELRGCKVLTFKDQVVFEADEILKSDGKPYTVFTPYSKRWLERFTQRETSGDLIYCKHYQSESHFENFLKFRTESCTDLKVMGFEQVDFDFPDSQVSKALIRGYEASRNYPGIKGTSRLGIHFRFGTISIRQKARATMDLSRTYLNELIWRDFYSQILAHFPRVATNAFKPVYDRIEWLNNSDDLAAWKSGMTGYPIVDAGMRELNSSGFMHNRVRMITASFLTKHLLIDWRLGEAYFAEKLLDYDLASNNGGWQWAAGSGTDAAPYFRIFNPYTQAAKFDPQNEYIGKWVPEFNSSNYPKPIVDHSFARERCLRTYKAALDKVIQS